ncbi:Uncharacterised protein [Bordetella pertussis]|nr:Uncharacterised protein [Bordetella pertussis]
MREDSARPSSARTVSCARISTGSCNCRHMLRTTISCW